MSNALPRLEKELAAVRDRAAEVARQLYGADVAYFSALAAASRQQLVRAVYHLCTRKYPKTFLKLSLNQRQDFQQTIRQVARELEWQLLHNLLEPASLEPDVRPRLTPLTPTDGRDRATTGDPSDPVPNPAPLELGDPAPGTAALGDLGNATAGVSSAADATRAVADGPSVASELRWLGPPLTERPKPDPNTLPPALCAYAGNPLQIRSWQRSLEKSTLGLLQAFSQRANECLRAAAIVPHQLPLSLLEIAGKTDLAAELPAGVPNLLDLAIDTSDDDGTELPAVRIAAIHLRLPEIELADAAVVAGRAPLQQLADRLGRLCTQYEKLQQQYAIAEAEAAWRSSWFDD